MDNLPSLIQKEIDIWAEQLLVMKLNQLSKTKHLPINKSLEPDSFTGEFHQTFTKDLTYILCKPFQKSWRGENAFIFILQSQYQPDSKTRQRYHKNRKLQANITDECWIFISDEYHWYYGCLNPQKILTGRTQQYIKRIIHHNQVFPVGTSGKEPAWQCKRHKRHRAWSLGQEDPLEEDMATHPSILTWRIPWMEKPGGLQSVEFHRFGHTWSDLACMHTTIKSYLP